MRKEIQLIAVCIIILIILISIIIQFSCKENCEHIQLFAEGGHIPENSPFCVPDGIWKNFSINEKKLDGWINDIIVNPPTNSLQPLIQPLPDTLPFLPVNYTKLKNHLRNSHSYKHAKYSVGIVGAGIAGIAAAHELLRLGFNVKVYEADRNHPIGGRMNTYRFKTDNYSWCELGAMRFTLGEKLLMSYFSEFNIKTSPMPDPIVSNTVINFRGSNVYVEAKNSQKTMGKYSLISSTIKKWQNIINPIIKRFRIPYTDKSQKDWAEFEKKLSRVSLIEFLTDESLKYGDTFTQEELLFFDTVGLGSGGFGPLDSLSIISFLKLIISGYENGQMVVDGRSHHIVGGCEQVPLLIWKEKVPTHNGRISLADIHASRLPAAGVKKVEKGRIHASKKYSFHCNDGTVDDHDYIILTPSPAVLTNNIEFSPPSILPSRFLLNELHMISSSKVFLLYETKFWKTRKTPPGKIPISTTVTDGMIHQMYLLDEWSKDRGVVLVSYTWENDSYKQLAYTDDQLVSLCIKNVNEIYGYEALSTDFMEKKVWHWGKQPTFHGAWVLPTPNTDVMKTANIIAETCNPNNDVFLASDNYSYFGGWVEGALQTSFNAVSSIHRNASGK